MRPLPRWTRSRSGGSPRPHPARALVVEYGLNRGALAGARALSAGGWTVGVAGRPPEIRVSASSRAVSQWHEVPSVLDEDAFVAAVARAVHEGGYEVIFPVDDGQLLALSRRRAEIGAVLPYAEHPKVVRALDRLQVTQAARAAGLCTPAEIEPDPVRLARRTHPVAIKARSYALVEEDGRPSRVETVLAAGPEAAERVDWLTRSGHEALVQEPVDGRLMALIGVMDRDGELLGVTQQEAERTWPAAAGVSVRAATVSVDAELARGAQDMLRDLGWFGLVELQFLVPEGAEPQLIDLNGRFYGSMSLAVHAGSNLPSAWARIATGRSLGPQVSARPGVRYQWLEADLRRALTQPGGARAAEVVASMRYGLGAVHSIGRLSDPGPLASVLALRLRGAAKRVW